MTVAGGAPGTARDGYRAAAEVTAVDLDALDKLWEAATPGEWRYDPREPRTVRDSHPRLPAALITFRDSGADAALIVAAVNALPELIAAVRAGLALHRPWYEIDGVRHENTVNVGCEQFDGCDGDADMWCADSDGDGHEVLACSECRCVVDYDIDGFLLWPCPTYRALTAPLAGQHTTDEETDRG